MKKILFLTITVFSFYTVLAQKITKTTNEFTIEGLVEHELVINLDSLKGYATESIDSVVITNHLGERKSVLKKIKVIPIKNFLDKAVIHVESPKQLSEFYIIFMAEDGYKVVYSWNEIFNNKVGQSIFIIAEKDGKSIANLDDRTAVFCHSDFMTGRRYVKSLKKIIVKRIE